MDDLIALLRSKLKVAILETLVNGQSTPILLAKQLKRPRPSISRSIKELEELKLVECTNPDADRWRKYSLTKKGRSALTASSKYR